jgi:hypothetical protein
MKNLTFLSIQVVLYLLLSTLVSACATESPPPPATPTPGPAVVVFATEASTTPTTAAPSPTATTAPITETASSAPINRPLDENPLTGLKVADPALLKRRPILVRVGNDAAARPQAGLNQADMVYEEITEWWITRFTAIYLSEAPETIAPIRSARLINLQLTPQYQGALANSGGSDPVRWELSQADLVNLDEFFHPTIYFYRPNEGWQTRLAFNAADARDYMAAENLESEVELRGFFFTPTLSATTAVTTPAQEITIPYPRGTGGVAWRYDPESGGYERFALSGLQTDAQGAPITATNVILYFAEHRDTDIIEDSNGATSIRIIVNGQGTAWVARDGLLMKGNWETNGRQTPQFTFANGDLIPLGPGRTWVEVVPLTYEIELDGQPHAREETAGPPAATVAPTPTLIGARPATPAPE